MNGTIACLEVEYAERLTLRAIFAVLLLAALSFAVPPGNVSCGSVLDSSGAYTMNASGAINGSTCFHIISPNVVLDCLGNSITGDGTNGTYGIYANQPNTTVNNCTVSGFPQEIYFDGTANSDNTIIGTIIGLALCAFIFMYLHANSESFIWAQLWLLFGVLMLVGVMMAISTFATQQGDTVLADVAYALFLAFIFVFILLIVRIMWLEIKRLIDELMRVLDGG